ncbi:MAG: PD40 domain-containing protein [Armatimonadetes bacterium]|nr:PD40 domain-containing protein [Armatimonadota bacterium]
MKATFVMALHLLVSSAGAAPTRLTDVPGDATEAAWSPDGRTIVYQSGDDGDTDLLLLDLDSGRPRPLVTGPGEALYPAWSPDGKAIVYAFSHPTRTVFQGLDQGCNLMLIPAAGGAPRRLTDGLVRDYAPSFSPDGRFVWFSSTRDLKQSGVAVCRLPVAEGAPERVIFRDADDYAAVQPALSPDGRFVAYGLYRGHRSNWTIQLARTDAPERRYPLTDPNWPCYGPRWSPDGKWLGCTCYQPGDPGWGVYLILVSTGGWLRLDAGPGNSRSPAWSPDGRQLVYENNQTGRYQLYRVTPQLPAQLPGPESVAEGGAAAVLDLSFEREPQGEVTDRSAHGNHGRVNGAVTWADGAVRFAADSSIAVPAPRGCDFGRRPFSVRADLFVERHTQALRLIAGGDYPVSRRGWQLYLDDQDRLWFNARSADTLFIGACTDGPLPTGKRLTVVGTRDRMGLVELFVDGVAHGTVGTGANLTYPAPTQICLGRQYDGTMPALGVRLYRFEVHPTMLLRGEGVAASLEEFLQP